MVTLTKYKIQKEKKFKRGEKNCTQVDRFTVTYKTRMSEHVLTKDNGKDPWSHTVEHWLAKICDGRELDRDLVE